jgi:poly(beta-D-mannuronate) lyase
VDGVLFQNGSFVEKGNKCKSVVTFLSHHGSLVNSAIIDFNPSSPQDQYYWVFFTGASNTVSKCYFKGKTNMSPLIGNDNLDAARNNSVIGCYFKDIPLSDVNGREIIRVWGYGKSGDTGPGGAFFTIEGNLFDHADGEGGEIISLKSNRNKVLRNTIVATEGWLNIRQGHYNLVEGNVILGNGVKKAYGLRMSGQYNEVKNNLLDGCSEGISISCGDYIDKDLTGSQEKHSAKRKDADGNRIPDDKLGAAAFSAQYPQNKYLKLTGNMVIACSGTDLDVGARYKAHWPKEQMVLIPEECRIENNIFVRPKGGDSVVGTTPSTEPPLNQFKFSPNIFTGNKLFGGVNKFAPAAAGCEFLPVPEGWSREKAIATFKPLTADQVGPAWIRGKNL